MELSTLRDPLYKIIRQASIAILEIYENPELFDVKHKDDNSPLTAADQASNAIICKGLEKLTPDIPIISEENKTVSHDVRKNYAYCWLVDPIDGTKEFIKRNGEFTINIALVEHGIPILGILHVPVAGKTYFGQKSKGAFRLEDDGPVPIRCDEFKINQPGLRILCSRSHITPATQTYVDTLDVPTMVPRGSSLKFTEIAEGRGDLYPRIGPTMEWDTAAPHIILEEAGGGVVEFATGRPLRYNKQNLLNPDFIAFGKGKINTVPIPTVS